MYGKSICTEQLKLQLFPHLADRISSSRVGYIGMCVCEREAVDNLRASLHFNAGTKRFERQVHIHHLRSPAHWQIVSSLQPRLAAEVILLRSSAHAKLIAWKNLIFIAAFMIESERCKLFEARP
jgi:hypothetical protein